MNKFYFKKIAALLILSWFFAPIGALAQTGNHLGEQKPFSYRIEYLDPLGITMADSTGITYKPFSGGFDHEDEILPEQYFGDYDLYFTGGTLRFQVFLKNNSPRFYRNLKIETFQEFLNMQGGQGFVMGSNNRQEWFLEKLGPNEEIMFLGEFAIPIVGDSGIDQTHLRISHDTPSDKEKGEIILEDFQAGLWCPVRL